MPGVDDAWHSMQALPASEICGLSAWRAGAKPSAARTKNTWNLMGPPGLVGRKSDLRERISILYQWREKKKDLGRNHGRGSVEARQNPGAPLEAGRISGAFTPKRRCANHAWLSDIK